MNDFDRFLEHKLRHMLDPLVAAQAPARGRRAKRTRPMLAVVSPADAGGVEPAAVTVVVSPLR